jgi:dTDP-4-dehydrorhamnose reductase
MLTVLITGSKGQLGSEINRLAASYPVYNFLFTDIDELDICSQEAVNTYFEQNNIDVVVNCAAYTAVDLAEDEPERAMAINRDAVANLARASKEQGAYLIHISTDYVFDGQEKRPYKENDPTHPQSSYGRSKLAGEELISGCLDKGMIIRTSWLYSTFGNNFIKTIIQKCPEKGQLNVVDDQSGCPTYARDLAKLILDIIPGSVSIPRFDIFHYSNEGECTWYELACAVVELAGLKCVINPISSSEYPQKAPRPVYSVLDTSRIRENFGISIPGWKESLKEMITMLNVEF